MKTERNLFVDAYCMFFNLVFPCLLLYPMFLTFLLVGKHILLRFLQSIHVYLADRCLEINSVSATVGTS